MLFARGRRILLAGGLALVLALVLGRPGPAAALDKVRLGLHWVHQAQFAGFYLAQDAGIYRKYGLEVEILPGGPGIDPLKDLLAEKCDFATGWLSGAMELRAQGYPLVLLAQLIQRSALLLVTFADRDISCVKDLNGRRVGLWGGHFNLLPHALFKREGIRVEEVPQNVSMTPLLRGAVDAAAAMYYNEYHQLFLAGVDLDDMVVFDFADLGLNFPEDGIYALESLRQKKPDLCRRFVQASLEGWRLTFTRPREALASVMKRVEKARLATNVCHQRWMLRAMQELITYRVGRQGLGELSPKDFELVNRVLVDQGLMDLPLDREVFYQPLEDGRP